MNEKLFPLPGNGLIMPNVPDVGEEPVPPGLIIHTILTEQLQSKLQEWQARTGVPMYELGNVVMRLGLMRLSMHIDEEHSRLRPDDVKELIPDGQNKETTT